MAVDDFGELGYGIPGLKSVFTTSPALPADDLIALRNRVEGKEKASASTAAKEWLAQKGLA